MNEFIPTARAPRGKGPRTRKQVRERRDRDRTVPPHEETARRRRNEERREHEQP